MAYYGRRVTTDPASGVITAAARASVYPPAPENGWAYTFGIHAGRSGGTTPNVRGHVWGLSSGNPSGLLANTAQLTAPNQMGSGTESGTVSGPLTAIYPLESGRGYALGAAVTAGSLLHGMIGAGSLGPSDIATYYERSAANTGPFNPMGYTSSFVAGRMSAWLEYTPNVAPNIPINRSPSGDIDGQPAQFVGAFRDVNEVVNGVANTNEKLKQYRIQLRVVGSSSLMWDATYTASPTEQTNRAFAHAYAGTPALDPGVAYEWRCQVSDYFGTFSDWSSWLGFKINAAGSVAVDGTGGVTGRQITLTPGPFKVIYAHVNGLSSNQQDVQILQGDTVVRSTTIVTTRAPGSWSIPWPGAFAALAWSNSFTWRVRARDTNGEYSGWSPAVAFNTDYRPSTPSNLTPREGTVVTGYPVLTMGMADQDDTPDTGLIAEVRIKSSTGTVISTRQATLRPGATRTWDYQTDGSDLPATGTYRWDARGRDGVLDGNYSAEADFFYAEAPTVTTPAVNAVITTTTLAIVYAVTGQVRRHFLIYPRGGTTAVLNTAWATTSTSFSANLDLSSFVINGALYDLVVEVELTGSVISRSARIPFEVLLNAGHSVAVNAAASGPIAIGSEPQASAIRMTRGTVAGVTAANFVAWRIKEGPADWLDRWSALIANPPVNPSDALRAKVRLAGELAIAAESRSFTDTSLVTFEPRLGVPRSYTLTAVIQAGVNVVESLPVTALMLTCDATAIVIHDIADPTGRRVMLERMEDGKITDERNQTIYETWSDGPPVIVESGLAYLVLSDTYKIVPTDGMSSLDTFYVLRSLRAEGPTSPTIICYRDDLGQRLDGRITALSGQRLRLHRMSVSLEVTEALR